MDYIFIQRHMVLYVVTGCCLLFVMGSCGLLFLFFTMELGASLSDLRIYNGIGVISLFTRWFGIPFSLAEEYSVLAGCCLSFTLRHFNNLMGSCQLLSWSEGLLLLDFFFYLRSFPLVCFFTMEL